MKLKEFLRSSILVMMIGVINLSADGRSPDGETVGSVDISKYMGLWYEVASIPVRFQRDCVATTAQYTLLDNGQVEVLNSCRKATLDGELKEAKGRGRVVEKETNSKLEVSFVGPFPGDTWFFWADYWIVELGKDYEYAVVGSPTKKYLWVLSREKEMNSALLEQILQRRADEGYDITAVKQTLQ